MTVPAHTNPTTTAKVLAETLWDMRRHIGLVVADWPTCVETAERHPGSLVARRVAEHRELVVAVHERLAEAGLLADPTARTEVEWGVACPLDDDVIPTADPDWSVRHHDRNCGPGHRLVRRTVTDWTPAEEPSDG